jgi:hypothetical protein
MRHTALIVRASAVLAVAIALLPAPAMSALAQAVDVDSMRRSQRAQVEQYRANVASAARVFIDASRGTAERLNAVRDVAAFLEQQQFADGMRIARTGGEATDIRVRALQLAAPGAGSDQSLAQQLAAFVGDPAAPAELRAEAARQLALQSFELHDKPAAFLNALRTGARDPNIAVRRVSLRALAGHGDSVALGLLQRGLEQPADALLPSAEAVELLGLKNPSPFYELLNRVMLQTRDTATRIAAIRLLGGHAASRLQLSVVLRDASEPASARHAALGALAAGDPQALSSQVYPVVADESAPLGLRLRGIKFVELQRTSRDTKIYARAADDFDRLMTGLADSSREPAVRAAARTYLTRTRAAR